MGPIRARYRTRRRPGGCALVVVSVYAFQFGAMLAAVLLGRVLPSAWLLGAAVAPALVVVWFFARKRPATGQVLEAGEATFGRDGVALSCEFLRYTEVLPVASAPSCIEVRLPAGRGARFEAQCVADLARVRDLLYAARGPAQRRARNPLPIEPLLSRQRDESDERWRARVDAAVSRERGYRDAARDDSALWEVLGDAQAEPSARAAAALLLARGATREGRARIAEVAEPSAHPCVRAALDEIAREERTSSDTAGARGVLIHDAPSRA